MEQHNSCDGRFPPISVEYPWLVIQNPDTEEDSHIFFNLSDPLCKYQCRVPELLKKCIRGCYHGWLILSDHSHNWSLWNPVSSQVIPLPRLILKDEDYESITQCCLSAPPHNPASVLILTNTKKPTLVFCRVDRKKERLRWIEMSYDKQLMRITGEDGSVLLHSLTCCDGKVYALNTDNGFASFVIKVDIRVKDREVEIKLSLFGICPYSSYKCCPFQKHYLKGSGTELFYIKVDFHDITEKTLHGASTFKLDMISRNCEEMEVFKDLDMTGLDWKDMEDFKDLDRSLEFWEELEDLKDAIFYVDVARDFSIFYTSTVASELGGNIHIRGECGKIIYSYHVKKRTISLSSMPSLVLPTSNVLLWECRLQDDHKCTIGSKHDEEVEDKEQEMVVRSVMDQEVELNESWLLNLPSCILELIMELCVGVEYMKFRATCRPCRLAAPLIQRRNETSLRILQSYSLLSPWLVVVDKNQGILTFTDPVFGDNYYMKNSRVLVTQERICCSRFGWLLFESSDLGCLVFFNPFTNDLRKLPDAECNFKSMCFSAPPTSPNCMVVGFDTVLELEVLIHFVGREPSWRTVCLDDNPISIRFPTFYGQDIYALCNDGKVVVFKNLDKENNSWKIFEAVAPTSGCRSLPQYYLMKWDQHILLVIVDEIGKLVEVFKWNDSIEEWEKIDDLGRHMIYICGTTCICIEAKIPEMENKILFPRLHSKKDRIVFYSLETRRYHTFNGKNIEENLGDFIGTCHHLNPHVWIEPMWV